MPDKESNSPKAGAQSERRSFPLQHTASVLNQRLGLYLSAEQQKGLATGLLIGSALAGALLARSIAEAIHDR